MQKQPWEVDAEKFVTNEVPFHLGFLVTESSHPYTKNFSETIQQNTGKGVAQLLLVDTDIQKAFRTCSGSAALGKLQKAVVDSVLTGKRIIFSGCGSTGRLSVLLEAMWRKGCLREADRLENEKIDTNLAVKLRQSAKNVRGIITGGDRALIKSVENFEDYQEFGRQQVRELNLRQGDIFVAISEGGETSSVIGTAHEALAEECETFFVFNNPSDLLCERIERSRKLIENPLVTSIDLTTGPMAVSGSTRMQATTMELLVIGAILEIALVNILKTADKASGYSLQTLSDYGTAFDTLLQSLQDEQSVESMASVIEIEEQVYRNGEMIVYTINDFLLDIFTDTTERTPTFSIPPLRSIYSRDDPPPWAVALQLRLGTPETWMEMLGRKPVGLDWNPALYEDLLSPAMASAMAAHPPDLGLKEIYSYKIGYESIVLYKDMKITHVRILVLDSVSRKTLTDGFMPSQAQARNISSVHHNLILSDSKKDDEGVKGMVLSLAIPATPLRLFTHIAAKIVFNTISTGTMARLGRIKGNWMIEVTPSNKKLIDRSIRILSDLKSISYREAAYRVFKEIHSNPDDLSSLVARLL